MTSAEGQGPGHSTELASAPQGGAEPLSRKEVGGCLLFFCFLLTLLGPVYTVGSLVVTARDLWPHFDRIAGLRWVVGVDIVLSVGLMTFSIYVGTRLGRALPGAVQLAKRYLWCHLAYRGVAALLPFVADLPPEAKSAVFQQVVVSTMSGLVFFAVWYTYLTVSKRVAETFPD